MAELQAVLDKATKLLTRNSANLGTEVDSLSQENAKLTGLVMEAKRTAEGVKKAVDEQNERLGDLEKRIMALENKKTEAPRKTPEAIFTEGKTLFDSKQWVAARDRFKQIVIRHSTANIAPEAQYYRAETHYREADYKARLASFKRYSTNTPRAGAPTKPCFEPVRRRRNSSGAPTPGPTTPSCSNAIRDRA